jgi:aminotransferase
MSTQRSRTFQLSPIKEIEIAAARRPGSVSLAQGIPDFDTPEPIKAYVKEQLDQGKCAKYSLAPGLSELREQIAESLREEGMRYDPDGEILVTAGAIEAIAATLIALTEPGQEVILPSPSYASYQQVIRLAGCVPRFVPLDEENNFDLDVPAIAKLITPRTAAIFYCNPNNPTGTIYSRQQSLEMMALAERHGLYIITDEVYKDFLYTAEPYFTPAQEEAFRKRVVRIFSFSKAYAMTGWRVGYLHGDRAVVSDILKAHDALVTCAPVISQHAALAALTVGRDSVAEFRAAYRRRRDLTLARLDQMSHVFDYQKPNGSYFVFPRVKDPIRLSGDSRALAFDLLERAGVALVPGIAFGPTGESHLRMSFGRRDEDIEEAFARMKPYFEQGRFGTFPASLSGGAASGVPAPGPTSSDTVASDTVAPDTVAAAPAVPAEFRRATRFPRTARAWAVGYLQILARFYLWRRKPGVIAIAGNQGKTVLKRVLARALGRSFSVRANPRSYNTDIGLPLAVLGLEINPRSWPSILATLAKATLRAIFGVDRPDWLILELGSRHSGDMAALLRTVHPDWAVVTNLSSAEGDWAEPQAVLQAELDQLLARLPAGRVLMSEDDALLKAAGARMTQAPIPLGEARWTRVRGGHLLSGEGGNYEVGPEWVGASSAYAIQAAVRLADELGVPREQIQEFLRAETGRIEPGLAGPGLTNPAGRPPLRRAEG